MLCHPKWLIHTSLHKWLCFFCFFFFLSFWSPAFSLRCEGTSSSWPVHVPILCPLQTHQPPQKQQVQLPQQVRKKQTKTSEPHKTLRTIKSNVPSFNLLLLGNVPRRVATVQVMWPAASPLTTAYPAVRWPSATREGWRPTCLTQSARETSSLARGTRRTITVAGWCLFVCACAHLQMFTDLSSSWLPVFRIGRPPKYRKNQQREYQSEFSDNSQYPTYIEHF